MFRERILGCILGLRGVLYPVGGHPAKSAHDQKIGTSFSEQFLAHVTGKQAEARANLRRKSSCLRGVLFSRFSLRIWLGVVFGRRAEQSREPAEREQRQRERERDCESD